MVFGSIAIPVLMLLGATTLANGAMETYQDPFCLSGHPMAAYNGQYTFVAKLPLTVEETTRNSANPRWISDWFSNSNGKFFYRIGGTHVGTGIYSSGTWLQYNFDDNDQVGGTTVQNWHGGGFYADGYLKNAVNSGELTVRDVPSVLTFVAGDTDHVTVSGHPTAAYNGDYTKGPDWDGKAHYSTTGGAHMYVYDSSEACDKKHRFFYPDTPQAHVPGACWNFDMTDQTDATGLDDLDDGGYLSTFNATQLPNGASNATRLPFKVAFADCNPTTTSGPATASTTVVIAPSLLVAASIGVFGFALSGVAAP